MVEIYNFAVATRAITCDIDPIEVSARAEWFAKHSKSRRPIWVAEDRDAPKRGVVGYLGFNYFMNERPGYFITADLAIYLHPDYQSKGLGSYLLNETVRHAPSLGVEVLAATLFRSNLASRRLFERHGFELWGTLPRVARIGSVEHDVLLMGRRLG